MRIISTSRYQGLRGRPKKMFLLVQPLHKKPYFFPNVLKRWPFQKNCTGIWSFLYNQERWCFLSLKIWPYFFRGKWKMIFLKKVHGNMIYSSNVLKRWSFQKNRTGIWSFFYHQEIWHFFFPKMWYFFYRRKMKDNLSQKIHANMIFVVCSVKMVFLFPANMKLRFCPKIKDDLFPKNTLRDDISDITEKDDLYPRKDDFGILDWHSRKSSNDPSYFYGDLFKDFHILLSNGKNPGNVIYRTEVWLYL